MSSPLTCLRSHLRREFSAGLLLFAAAAFALEPTPRSSNRALGLTDLPGQRPDGSVLLPNQWSLRPVGRQIPLGDFPVNIALHPAGRFAAVLHAGHGPHQILVVDLKAEKVVSTNGLPETFYGLEFSRSGDRLCCSGAGDEVIHVFEFDQGRLKAAPDLRLREAAQRGIPCGLALSRDGRKLFAANLWGQSISELDLAGRTNCPELGFAAAGTNGSPDPGFETRKPVDPEVAAVTKRAQAVLDPSSPEAPFPYACRLDERRQRLYVSLWAQSCVAVIDLKLRQVVARWATGEHPNEMALTKSGNHLFVANANLNTVTVLDTETGKAVETLDSSLSPTPPLPGSTPNSLALSPDERRLFVANACNNNVAVFDISTLGKSRSLGHIPVGWYPTSVRVTRDGRHLLVANGKGLLSRANVREPEPGSNKRPGMISIHALFPGALSIIDLPKGKEFEAQLAAYTAQAYACTPQHSVSPKPRAADNPVPAELGKPGPIKYCIYIIKENRTYDQIFGDLPQGNGDPRLCIFPEKITPNHHKLAREFVLFDNFYVDAEVSADGHEWTVGGYATDFVEKHWPLSYGHNRRGKYPYPSEGAFPIARPANGYLWDRAKAAGVSYRSYGEFVYNPRSLKEPGYTRQTALQGHFDPWFRSFDTGYPDVQRAARFISELKRFGTNGEMPQLQILRLPNDHTAGTSPNTLTPNAFLADNDYALGQVVEAVSRSKFWPQTAIFVVEDDAQAGPDHVDAHRSVAFVISPYTRRGMVDSTMYSTTSMLRTIGLILGLAPLSQFDAAATPMFNAFQAAADLRPYEVLPPNVDLKEHNSRLAWGSEESRKMDFSKEDAADDLLLNEIIWRFVRGADHPMPAPVHAAFVRTQAAERDED